MKGDATATLDSRDAFAAGLVFFVALAIRAFHLHDLAMHDPFYALPSVDGAVYDAWAKEILTGDWLGEGVLFMGPGYPAFMSAVYKVFGPSIPALKAIHAFLGALSCVLIWGIARELFDRRAAALAGGLAAFHGMLIFYGGTVTVVNLQVPLIAGLCWALIRTLRKPSYLGFALCGLLLGFSVLARQTVLVMAPLIALWILFGMPDDPLRERFAFKQRFAWGSTFGIAICLLILPFTIKNYVAGDDLVLLNSTGGANFYMGNQRKADGTWQVPSIGTRTRIDNPKSMQAAFSQVAERENGRAMKASEVSSYWFGRGLDEIKADPSRWVRLELRKAVLFFNKAEIWNNRSYEVSRDFSRVLRMPLVGFGLIAPLGLLGLALSLARWRELVPVYGALGAYLVSAFLFFVLSRYRMPAAILLAPFAGFAAMRLIDTVRAGDFRALAKSAFILVAFSALVHWPLPAENRMHMAYYNLGNKFRELERWDEAVTAYRTSLDSVPGAISTHNNLAVALELSGRRDEAIEAWKTVGVLAMRRGDQRRIERSVRHLRELGALPPEPELKPPAETGTDPAIPPSSDTP